MVSEREIEAARAVLERRIYDEGGCEAQQVPAMVREMLEAAARVRAEANAGEPVGAGEGQRYSEYAAKLNDITDRDIEDAAIRRNIKAAQPSGPVEALKRITQAKEVRRGGGVFDYEPVLSAGEMYEIALDALSALTAGKPEQSRWQPIETAPKDGTNILGWHEIAGTSQTCFSEGEWVCPDWDEDQYIHCTWSPTHWMPLPAPPTAGGREMSARETIVAAAISHNGLICTMPQPARHHHILHRSGYSSAEEGFLTSEGRFVDRKKAAELAIKAGQIDQLRWPPYLYSEDLW